MGAAIVSLFEDNLKFFIFTVIIIVITVIFFIGLAKGWWALKTNKVSLENKGTKEGEKEETLEEDIDDKEQKILEERDGKWYNVTTRLIERLQDIDDEKNEIRHDCLVKQLGYVDDTFEGEKTVLWSKMVGNVDRKNEKVQLAEYRFDNTYHKTQKEIVQVIKNNSLLKSTEEELKERIKKRAKKYTTYFEMDIKNYPITIDEKAVEEYIKFVETTAINSMINARNLAKKREDDIRQLYNKFNEDMKKIIQDEIPKPLLKGAKDEEK